MRRWLGSLIAVLAGCPDGLGVPDQGVLSLGVCHGETPCTATADGHGTAAVSVCVPGHDARPANLAVTLTLSRGSWQVPTDAAKPQVLVASLPEAACVDVLAVMPADLEPVYVYAQLAGYTQRRCIQMVAPAPTALSLTSNPPVLASGLTIAIVSATVAGATGYLLPTATTVTFSADIAPAGPFTLQPQQRFIDAAGVAPVTVVVPAAAQSVTIHATAQVPAPTACPDEPPGSAPAAVTAKLTIPRLPIETSVSP